MFVNSERMGHGFSPFRILKKIAEYSARTSWLFFSKKAAASSAFLVQARVAFRSAEAGYPSGPSEHIYALLLPPMRPKCNVVATDYTGPTVMVPRSTPPRRKAK